MPTIQVRDVPQDAYEVLRRRAASAGQSLQAYMRAQVIGLASQPDDDEIFGAAEGRWWKGSADGCPRRRF